jgi:putative sigma-54 modulation protein
MLEPTSTTNTLDMTDFLRDYVNKRVGKLDRYFPSIVDCRVELSVTNAKNAKHRQVAQVTIRSRGGTILRAEERSADMLSSVDAVTDKIYRQIARFKGKRHRGRGRAQTAAEAYPVETPQDEEEGPNIVRVKRFEVTAMTPQEAIEQMELLGHDFFIFYNPDADNIAVVYRRKDGNYGLLEPELA